MKKLITMSSVVLATLLFSSFSVSAEEAVISVQINNQPVVFEHAEPVIMNDRTLVPLRGVFDNMGFAISWDEEAKVASLAKGTDIIRASTARLELTNENGTNKIGDIAPQLIDGYFMIPVRAVAEATGAQVDWDNASKVVTIIYEEDEGLPVESDPMGTMKVEEKEYLEKLNQITKELKEYAIRTDDSLLLYLLGLNYSGEVKPNGDEEYYQELRDKIGELALLEVPDNMFEVQTKVDEYMYLLKETTAYAVATDDSNADLLLNLEESVYEMTTLAQEFGVVLHNYFRDNKVLYEKIYGDSILDALRQP